MPSLITSQECHVKTWSGRGSSGSDGIVRHCLAQWFAMWQELAEIDAIPLGTGLDIDCAQLHTPSYVTKGIYNSLTSVQSYTHVDMEVRLTV